VGKKQSAQASLEKLSRGLTRETPATRTQETPEQLGRSSNAVEGGGEVTQEGSSPTAKQERPRQRTGRPRTKPERMVRVSVDLPRPDHRFLRNFAYDAESDGMRVMRALLEEMRDDKELAERVLDRLATR
jgi:hypothetical protein